MFYDKIINRPISYRPTEKLNVLFNAFYNPTQDLKW